MRSIISYNVNGLRSAISKGFLDWIAQEQPDIIGLQEIKAQQEDIDLTPIEQLGYHHYWHPAQKKGYSGVATLTKLKPSLVIQGCGLDKYDREGRCLRTDFDDWTLLNCYLPSGTTGDERQKFKMEFLEDFYELVQQLRKERPNLVILGDYNIAHNEIDIHNPKSNKNSSGFLPEERAWMTKWLSEGGFTDAFRTIHPSKQEYSWWSFRANSRANNKGWRIDYQCVSGLMVDRLQNAGQLTDIVHSDHCPVWAHYNLP